MKGLLIAALPDGSLEQATFELFERANLPVYRRMPRNYTVEIGGGDIFSKGVIMRPQVIPDLVSRGDYDVGFCGEDCVFESGSSVEVVCRLAYSKVTSCAVKVVLFTHAENPVEKAEDVPPQSTIVSEHPNCTRAHFQQLGIPVTVLQWPGKTESAVSSGTYAYGVCVSETHNTLTTNKLKVIGELFESHTVLIASPKALEDKAKKETIRLLELLLCGTLESRDMVMLFMNVPVAVKKTILGLLPALQQPTVSPLVNDGFVAINTVVSIEKVNDVIKNVLQAGAQGVIQVPVTKLIRSW